MIHGSSDTYIKPEMARTLFALAVNPSNCGWWRRGTQSGAADRRDVLSTKKSLSFFLEHLGEPREPVSPDRRERCERSDPQGARDEEPRLSTESVSEVNPRFSLTSPSWYRGLSFCSHEFGATVNHRSRKVAGLPIRHRVARFEQQLVLPKRIQRGACADAFCFAGATRSSARIIISRIQSLERFSPQPAYRPL